MHFKIRTTGRHLWIWVLLDEAEAMVAESDRSFPTQTQASAAAMAFAQLVARAGRSLNAGSTGSLI
ncbi:hypothetical protein [Methylobacterium sp. PvR107]|uniref:hypothetical protein n=1 Tax=Methylobacterium sp. PvR107 TaxID=2806597 RepID=UPI001AE5A225|nr:hypothetical protein [Methylobacterium sp. PvR107]MBP1182272.1 hypothetical protein [Methylobacterium sp. PvR107]